MDLKQLEHFIAVAELRNFTRAAERLHIVQSGLSASIRALEAELGTSLFIRTTRRVDPTPTGLAFLAEARRVLAAAADARLVVDQMQGVQRGTLSIGLIQGVTPLVDVAEILGRFRARCPKVEIRVVSGGSLPLIEGVRSGALDLAFTQFAGALPRGVAGWMLACEPLVAVCAPDHALAGRRGVTLAALVEEVFVDLHPDWGTRQLVDSAFAAQHLSRRSSFEVDDLATQLDLVAHGLGIALVPEGVIAHRLEDRTAERLGVAALADPEICWELTAVFAEDEAGRPASAATRLFLGLLRSAAPVLEEIAGGA